MTNVELETSVGPGPGAEDLATEIEALEAQVAKIRRRISELEALRARALEAPPETSPSRDDPTLPDASAQTAVGRAPSALERMAKRVLHSSIGGPLIWRVAENDLAPMAAALDGEAAALAGYLLATVRDRLEDPVGAEQALRQAWSRTGGHPLIALGLGEHFLRIDEPADAVAYLDLARRADLGAVRSRGEVETLLAEASARVSRGRIQGPIAVDEDQIEVVEEVPRRRAGTESPTAGQDSVADPREAIEALEATLMIDPGQLDAVQGLLRLCEQTGAEPQREVCANLLGLASGCRPAASQSAAQDSSRAPISRAEAEALLPEALREPARLGALLWEHAPTLFRADPRTFGVSAADRLSPLDDSPLAVLWAIARRCLDLPRTAAFVRPGNCEIVVAPTLPPSIVCGSDLRLDSPRERFRVVRAIASTRAEHLLWSALPTDRARAAYDSLRWAFGRPSHAGEPTSHAAALGKEYRRLLPPRVQRELRDRIGALELPEFSTVRGLGDVATARAALLVTRDLAAALEVVVADDPGLRGSDLGSRDGLQAAIRRSELAAELVRFALSDARNRHRAFDTEPCERTTGKWSPASLRLEA